MSVILGHKVKEMKTKKVKLYPIVQEEPLDIVSEPMVPYITEPKTIEYSHLVVKEGDNIQFWKSLGIKQDISSDTELLKLIKIGVSKNVLQKVMEAMGIHLEEMADLLHTTDRTLRRYDNDTILNTEQSERILELAKLYSFGKDVFGNLAKFNLWMNDKIMALGNHTPKEFLDTSLGIQMLTQILGRIQYGVYS
jgi:putative toxin-antitoxin system antitoxin component (TIGR02293 family)